MPRPSVSTRQLLDSIAVGRKADAELHWRAAFGPVQRRAVAVPDLEWTDWSDEDTADPVAV